MTEEESGDPKFFHHLENGIYSES